MQNFVTVFLLQTTKVIKPTAVNATLMLPSLIFNNKLFSRSWAVTESSQGSVICESE